MQCNVFVLKFRRVMLGPSSGRLNLVQVDGPQHSPETNSINLKKEAASSLKRENDLIALLHF